MATTPNYGLLLYEENDIPSWLEGWNDTMQKIDTACAEIAASIPESANLQPVIDLANQANVTANKALARTGDIFAMSGYEIGEELTKNQNTYTITKDGVYNLVFSAENTSGNAVIVGYLNGLKIVYNSAYRYCVASTILRLKVGDILTTNSGGGETHTVQVWETTELNYRQLTKYNAGGTE